MGILNVTPDSFSDGGRYISAKAAVDRARQMVAQGADIVDIGGESTRPGAEEVSVQDEIARVIPAIKAIVQELDVLVSIDTSKPEVMAEAIAAGVHIINDVNALRAPGAVELIAESSVGVALMHMQGKPRSMQHNPQYLGSVTLEVGRFLSERIECCKVAGVSSSRLAIDPGFGFGKSLEHNLDLMDGLGILLSLGYPLLVGMSRKSMIGALLDKPVEERVLGSAVMAALAVQSGAHIVRVHDVAETADALKLVAALQGR